MASVFTRSIGTVHECNISAAVTIIRIGEFIVVQLGDLHNRAGSSINGTISICLMVRIFRLMLVLLYI